MRKKLLRFLKRLKKPKAIKTTIPKEESKSVQPVQPKEEVKNQNKQPEQKKKRIVILINKKDNIEEDLTKDDVKKISKNFSMIFEEELNKLLEKEKNDS